MVLTVKSGGIITTVRSKEKDLTAPSLSWTSCQRHRRQHAPIVENGTVLPAPAPPPHSRGGWPCQHASKSMRASMAHAELEHARHPRAVRGEDPQARATKTKRTRIKAVPSIRATCRRSRSSLECTFGRAVHKLPGTSYRHAFCQHDRKPGAPLLPRCTALPHTYEHTHLTHP